MLYLVNGQIKRKVETIIDVERYDHSGVYFITLFRFSDGSLEFEESCTEVSWSLLSYLKIQRTKLLLKLNSWLFGGKQTEKMDSIIKEKQ
jgi:hypothetical protein